VIVLILILKIFIKSIDIKKFPHRLIYLKYLEQIISIKIIPKFIYLIRNLKYLNLTGNYIHKIYSEIGKLKNLECLNLAGNCLVKLPTEIGLLTNLTQLILNGNNLVNLASEIGNLNELVKLELDFNELENLQLK
jgi:Leucine-rich repeat (LRR) protein